MKSHRPAFPSCVPFARPTAPLSASFAPHFPQYEARVVTRRVPTASVESTIRAMGQ